MAEHQTSHPRRVGPSPSNACNSLQDLNRALLSCLLKVRARRGTPREIGPAQIPADLFAPTLDDKIAELQAALSTARSPQCEEA